MTKHSLYLLCDYREASLSRAADEARNHSDYQPVTAHIRSEAFGESLRSWAQKLKPHDKLLICLLHTSNKRLIQAAKALNGLSAALKKRITLSTSQFSPKIQAWAQAQGIACEINAYEGPRSDDWSLSHATNLSLGERRWIQYRLMLGLIAGEYPEVVFNEILATFHAGTPYRRQLQKAEDFYRRGEPDMAGGNYAEERAIQPNSIDILRDKTVVVGGSGLNTLIIGETGTGKESLAWYLHEFSNRSTNHFLALNCAFFESERLESELFGHEQGAFTDAKKAKRGLVEEANGGTIFLDEIPEMSERVQAKLLRFLQDGSYTSLGGNTVKRADTRVICAAQPERMTSIRPDLYYRIADAELHTIPLRELAQRDIVNIACNLAYRLMWQRFVSNKTDQQLTPDKIRPYWERLSQPEYASALATYHWPGNMRELSTCVKRMILLNENPLDHIAAKSAPSIEPLATGMMVHDQEWQDFTLPVRDVGELASRSLNIKNLQAAYVRNLVASLGGPERIQPTKLAKILGCSYNALKHYLDSADT